MAKHERLISFLEEEAQVLRSRISSLKSRDIEVGVETGDGTDTRLEAIMHETERKLARVEEHLSELKAERAA